MLSNQTGKRGAKTLLFVIGLVLVSVAAISCAPAPTPAPPPATSLCTGRARGDERARSDHRAGSDLGSCRFGTRHMWNAEAALVASAHNSQPPPRSRYQRL